MSKHNEDRDAYLEHLHTVKKPAIIQDLKTGTDSICAIRERHQVSSRTVRKFAAEAGIDLIARRFKHENRKGSERKSFDRTMELHGKSIKSDLEGWQMTLSQIARKHGVSSDMVVRVGMSLKVDLAKRKHYMLSKSARVRAEKKAWVDDMIQRLNNTDDSIADLADEYRVARETIRIEAAKQGIDLKARANRIRLGQRQLVHESDRVMGTAKARSVITRPWVRTPTPRCFYYGGVA